jgi:hypothetical protein
MKVFKNLAYQNRHIQKFHAKLPNNLGKIEIHIFWKKTPKKNPQYKHCVYIHLIALLPITQCVICHLNYQVNITRSIGMAYRFQ